MSVAAPTSIITACWDDIRVFHSLAGGTVDYCRAHLAYVPGALDCYQFAEQGHSG